MRICGRPAILLNARPRAIFGTNSQKPEYTDYFRRKFSIIIIIMIIIIMIIITTTKTATTIFGTNSQKPEYTEFIEYLY
jgi:hypothetical protein